jgi:hypothetical protein
MTCSLILPLFAPDRIAPANSAFGVLAGVVQPDVQTF